MDFEKRTLVQQIADYRDILSEFLESAQEIQQFMEDKRRFDRLPVGVQQAIRQGMKYFEQRIAHYAKKLAEMEQLEPAPDDDMRGNIIE